MTNKVIGFIFILFGMGLLGDSIEELSHNSISIDAKSIKAILGVGLGIASSIYGYKRMKNEHIPQSKKDT